MQNVWIITNDQSGSFDQAGLDQVCRAFKLAGQRVARIIRCPADPLPDSDQLDRAGIAMLTIYAGDGTINSALAAASGWGGTILVLPGGTMNLLVRALHGDAEPAAIVARAVADPVATRIKAVAINGDHAYVGVIAGPTTAWAEVREGMRRADLSSLLTSAIPTALSETFAGAEVGFVGGERRFPALFAMPRRDGLHLSGFTTDSALALLQHGMAWLQGDFREGPHIELGRHDTVTLLSDSTTIGLLIDGEIASCAPGTTLRLVTAPHRLLTTRVDHDRLGVRAA